MEVGAVGASADVEVSFRVGIFGIIFVGKHGFYGHVWVRGGRSWEGGLLIEGAEVGKLCQSQVAGDGKCKKESDKTISWSQVRSTGRERGEEKRKNRNSPWGLFISAVIYSYFISSRLDCTSASWRLALLRTPYRPLFVSFSVPFCAFLFPVIYKVGCSLSLSLSSLLCELRSRFPSYSPSAMYIRVHSGDYQLDAK